MTSVSPDGIDMKTEPSPVYLTLWALWVLRPLDSLTHLS
jgi:hypothetical protein